MPKYANYSAERPIKDVLRANGGGMFFSDLKAALEAAGQGELTRDVLSLHLAGKLPGIVRARPNDKPALYLSADPLPPTPDASAPAASSGTSGNVAATNLTGNAANTAQ